MIFTQKGGLSLYSSFGVRACGSIGVARMERSGIRDMVRPGTLIPDSGAARLHPGYAQAAEMSNDLYAKGWAFSLLKFRGSRLRIDRRSPDGAQRNPGYGAARNLNPGFRRCAPPSGLRPGGRDVE